MANQDQLAGVKYVTQIDDGMSLFIERLELPKELKRSHGKKLKAMGEWGFFGRAYCEEYPGGFFDVFSLTEGKEISEADFRVAVAPLVAEHEAWLKEIERQGAEYRAKRNPRSYLTLIRGGGGTKDPAA